MRKGRDVARPKRPAPGQMVMCRGPRCREICEYSKRWCKNCFAAIPYDQQASLRRLSTFLQDHPNDAQGQLTMVALFRDIHHELTKLSTTK